MKTLRLILILILGSASFVSSFAYDFEADGILYNIVSNEKQTVEVAKDVFYSYSGNITIPETVRIDNKEYKVIGIGDEAFAFCYRLLVVTIPKSITYIGEKVFFDCKYLTSINVDIKNKKYSSINGVLYNKHQTELLCCPGIFKGDFIIPKSVKSIADYAFYGCRELTSVDIPKSVKSIGEGAFVWCCNLLSINVDINNRKYYSVNGVLYDKHQTKILFCPITIKGDFIIPQSVRSIEDYTFYGCRYLTSVTIPESVTSIGNKAFSKCYRLTSVIIPKNVASIGEEAFADCIDLVSVTMPETLTVIGNKAFYGCYYLTSITIPESVTIIGNEAFNGCKKLTSIIIPKNVTAIGERAFGYCRDLTSINVDIRNNKYCSINGVLYNKHQTKILFCPITIKGDFIIPPKVKVIGDYAFYGCRYLTSVTIPESVTSIGNEAFWGCSNLTSITIPKNVVSIGEGSFAECRNLESVIIPENVTYIGESAFWDCYKLNSITIPESITSIEDLTFFLCNGLTSVNIPHNVISIGKEAFAGCENLISITIPKSVISIEKEAFADCPNLESIYLKWKSPQKAPNNIFECFITVKDIYKTATLYIPEDTLSEYQKVEPWCLFKNIKTWSSANSVKDNGNTSK